MDSFKRRIIMEDWNKNDWQGRRKDQYEFSTKAVVYSVLVMIIVLVLGLVITSFIL
jgi:uncharacterized membrane protein YidH (DUF202 family)